jgi:predicted RNA-binding protein YlqC (UPF0109 family)
MLVVTSLDELPKDFSFQEVIAVDVEGVDLGRNGKVSLISICDNNMTFIFDVLDKSNDDPLILFLKSVLENECIVKVIHDCRMDSDALFFHFDIDMQNVHDTQCWHNLISKQKECNLNDMLVYYNKHPNVFRDAGKYMVDHEFWAIRPLSDELKSWAVGDISLLLDVHQSQVKSLPWLLGQAASNESLLKTRNMKIKEIQVQNVGIFIGKQGRNIKKLKEDTGTLIYPVDKRIYKKYRVYYNSEEDFQKVLRCAFRCQ